MAYSLTDSLKHNRFSVVDVDKAAGTAARARRGRGLHRPRAAARPWS